MFFVSKCLYTCQQNNARAGTSIFTPACFVRETFSPPAGAHFRCNHDCTRFAGPSWSRALLRARSDLTTRIANGCRPYCLLYTFAQFIRHQTHSVLSRACSLAQRDALLYAHAAASGFYGRQPTAIAVSSTTCILTPQLKHASNCLPTVNHNMSLKTCGLSGLV